MPRLPIASTLGVALFSLPALAQTPQSERAPLAVGPLIGGQPLIVDWRSGLPSGLALLLLDFEGGPLPLAPQFAAPALGVGAGASIFLFPTDAAGKLRIVLPTVPGQFPFGTGLRLFAQCVGFAPNGTIVVSNAAASTIEPSPVPPGFLVPSPGDLPASAPDLGAILVRAADFDGDGHPDLVLAGDHDIHLWRNDGSGRFVDGAFSWVHDGSPVAAIAVGDVDGDGRFDLFVASSGGAPDRLWRNDGSGSFSRVPSFPGGSGATSDFGLGDFDGDGDLDVVVTTGTFGHSGLGGKDRLFRNDGAGNFAEYDGFILDTWNGTSDSSTSVAVGDVDGDGHLDLYITKSGLGGGGARNVLLLNDGAGNFYDVTAVFLQGAFADRSAHAVFADLDLDGDLDIVVANSVMTTPTSASNDVWVNQGGAQGGFQGMFADDPASFLEPMHGAGIRLRVRVADIDADGDLDVLVATHDFFPPAPQLLFLNQGGRQGGAIGTFVRDTSFQPGNFIAGDAAIFDADSDGRADVVMVASGVLGGDPAFEFAVRYLRNSVP